MGKSGKKRYNEYKLLVLGVKKYSHINRIKKTSFS